MQTSLPVFPNILVSTTEKVMKGRAELLEDLLSPSPWKVEVDRAPQGVPAGIWCAGAALHSCGPAEGLAEVAVTATGRGGSGRGGRDRDRRRWQWQR